MPDMSDNEYQIQSLTSDSTFYDWLTKENNEIIPKLNLLKVYNGASGSGIRVVVGTTSESNNEGGPEGDVASGTMRISLSDAIPHGVTFQDDLTVDGVINYDFLKSEMSGTRIRFHGNHSSYSDFPGPSGWVGLDDVVDDVSNGDFHGGLVQGEEGEAGFTFGMPVRLGQIYAYNGDTGGTTGDWKYKSDTSAYAGHAGIFRSQADSKTNSEVLGLVVGITNDYMEIQLGGRIVPTPGDTAEALAWGNRFKSKTDPYTGIGGATSGCTYFVHAGVSGAITDEEPDIVGQVSKPILTGMGSTGGVILSYRGQFINTGTGDTGPGDTNRITIDFGADTHGLEVGQVIGYRPGGFDTGDGGGGFTFDDERTITNGWFYSSDDWSSHYAVGILYKNYSTQISGIATSGHLPEFPTSLNVRGDSETPIGLLFPRSNGYLTNTNPGNIKPFAFVWNAGGERHGTIVNQLGNATPGPGEGSDGGVGSPMRSVSSGVTSGAGSGVGENILINGGFDIWQRNVGVEEAYGFTGSTYFADRWVRVDGVSGAGSTANCSLQRLEFAENQTTIEGNPNYYLRAKHSITGTSGDHMLIENRIEDVRSIRDEQVSLSFWAESSVAGKTLGAIFTHNYDGINNQKISDIRTGGFELTSAWKKYSVSFLSPEIDGTTPTGEHYVAVGFDTRNTGTSLIDLAQVKLERGTASTDFAPVDVTEELRKCSRYYQRSYDKDVSTRTHTMMADCLPDLTVVDFTITPDRDYYHRFPVEMRHAPDVDMFSPKSGITGDAFNRSACKDVRLTSGTKGYSDTSRVSPTGTDTIEATAKKHGIRFYVKDGAVIFDSVSLHYVADADLNGNL